MRFKKIRKVSAADFFFTFDQKNHIHRKRAVAKRFLDSQNMRENLPLVVRRASRKNPTVPNLRFKRRRCPCFQRLRRLHIVMSVDQHRPLSWITCAFSNHHRMPRRFRRPGFQADFAEFCHEPFGTISHVLPVVGLRGYTGKSQEFKKFFEAGIIHKSAIYCGQGNYSPLILYFLLSAICWHLRFQKTKVTESPCICNPWK